MPEKSVYVSEKSGTDLCLKSEYIVTLQQKIGGTLTFEEEDTYIW